LSGNRESSVSAIIRKQTEKHDTEERYKPISITLIWRLAVRLKPYKNLYALGLLCAVAGLALDLLSPIFTKYIIDDAIPSGSWLNILHWAGILAGALALGLLLDALQTGATHRCGERVIQDLRYDVFEHLQRLSMNFFDRTKLGRIITRGTSDIESIRGPVIGGLNTVIINALMMLGAGTMILVSDGRMFLALVWLIPLLALSNYLYLKKIGSAWQLVRKHVSRQTANLAENITGVRVVSAFNRQDENLQRFNALQLVNTQYNLKAANITGVYQPLLEFIRFSGQVIVLGYGGAQVMAGRLTAGTVMQIFFYWGFFMRPTINLGNFYNTLMQAMASAERVFGLLDLKPQIVDAPGARDLPTLNGALVFNHVTFGYDPKRPVLHDISLHIPAGKTYALVGATGSGKSSMLSLLARFYEFQGGLISVDGHDIRAATTRSLHKQMGLVLQVNYLFSGNILENIRYPKPGASDEEVYAAAKALDIHETFMSLPDGYKTEVGERGANVSLGLRQLICFTRVLLADPRLFLLDEATSSIDTVTENKIQRALEKLVAGRTTVIVAHRLSTIIRADCIVVLEHGRIIEQGTHAELLHQHGTYAGMYEHFISHQVGDEA